MWFVYLVRCRDNSLYCGISNDLEKRIREHNSGAGAKYTASRRPVFLVYSEKHPDAGSARKREAQVKKLTKENKERLVKAAGDSVDLDDLNSSDPGVKYGCAKNLITLSKNDPAKLFPWLPFFVKLLDSENRILKWTAIDVIGNVFRFVPASESDNLLGKLCGFLNSGNMITANHAVAALGEIALVKPERASDIITALLKVEKYSYETDECRNIAVGKVILVLQAIYKIQRLNGKTIQFVERQAANARPATRKKAEQFLKRIRP